MRKKERFLAITGAMLIALLIPVSAVADDIQLCRIEAFSHRQVGTQ